MQYITNFLCGYSASRLLYEFTHKEDFPEIGRYAIGIIIIALALHISGESKETIQKYLLVSFSVGSGVALARIV